MSAGALSLITTSPDDTAALAARLGARLYRGDTLLLEGPIGAGKTHFARALIQSLQDSPEDVPSPTFTLVQTYDTNAGEVWHSDLYRIGGPDQIEELGLFDAFEEAITLVEWPDRLGAEAPGNALHLSFDQGATDAARRITLHWVDGDWAGRLLGLAAPEAQLLSHAGWSGARAAALAGDASARSYLRLAQQGQTAVLMRDPDGDVARFANLAETLSEMGLSAPTILARDEAAGLLLTEDLGDAVFARVIEDDPAMETPLYLRATDVLLTLHRHAPPRDLPLADPAMLGQATDLVFDWYAPGAPSDARQNAGRAMRAALEIHAPDTDVMIVRDYHAENLIWLPDREGAAQAGLLDFQDAMLGHRAYDLVSLLTDARRDVSPATASAATRHYLDHAQTDAAAFSRAMAVLAAQRNLRILGIFARLAKRDGKPRYLALIPRVWGHLQTALANPALADLRRALAPLLPEPTPDVLAGLSRP